MAEGWIAARRRRLDGRRLDGRRLDGRRLMVEKKADG